MNRCLLRNALAALALLLPLTQIATASQAAKEIKLDAATLDKYTGQYRYQNEPDITLSFFRDGNQLAVESERMAHTLLHASSQNTFAPDNNSAHFIFQTDASGKVTAVKRVSERDQTEAIRISDQPQHNHFRPYDRKEFMIPMRDGVKLHAVVLRPTDTHASLPLLMQRTPYGVDESTSDSINSRYPELAQSGYIFVMEDIRGRYGSEGQFFMNRPIVDHHDPSSPDPNHIDETTDAYDTVAWLVKNIPNNNGRVGVMGISYPGFLAIESGIDPNPAVKAISPQAPMTNLWIGDDFFHNGAFRQTYGYDYAIGLETSKENTFSKLNEDAYDYFKDGSFAAAVRKSGDGNLPTWQAFFTHPSYDKYWQVRAVEAHLTKVTVPTLEVGGWWDQEDMWGPQAEYAALKPHDNNDEVFIVLGPWNHGEWARTTRSLGDVNFGAATGDQFRAQIEAPFFAHYLKDEGSFDLKDTASFQTGTNRWMRYSHWPPKEGVTDRNLYLDADGSLSFTTPTGDDATTFTAYTSDPANPVPYRKRPIEATYAPGGSGWYTWLVQDQRFLGDRKDVARWTTPVLDQPVTISGDIVADLYASTSGTDSDWIVKLIDVYPDDPSLGKMSGAQLMITDEIFRGRYRQGFDHPEATPANQPEEYKFSLHGADHVFLKGHRIMVQVQNTWFPLYDRNPQTFVPSIMTAAPSDYQAATQHIYGSAEHPSHLILPVAATN